jgi:hypothetical protein
MNHDIMLVLDDETEEEFELFHFLLRLNSAIGKGLTC